MDIHIRPIWDAQEIKEIRHMDGVMESRGAKK